MSAAPSTYEAPLTTLAPPSMQLAQAIFTYRRADAAISENNSVMIRNASRRAWTDEEIQHALSLQNIANAARHEVHRLIDLEYLVVRPEQRTLRIADRP